MMPSDNNGNQEVPHRRYMDNQGNLKAVEVMLFMQSQEQELKSIVQQVSRISVIEDVMNELRFKVGAIPDVAQDIKLVSWHEKLIKIIGTISLISIPALFSWAAMLQNQVSEIRSDLKVANVKIEFLATKVSKDRGAVAPTGTASAELKYKF